MDPSHHRHIKHQLCLRHSGVILFHEEQDGIEFVKWPWDDAVEAVWSKN